MTPRGTRMSTTTATGARIEIRGLTKRFGSFVAVDDLSFDVEPGRITGFLGPNGAGKTTTLRMLLGLVHSTSGTATIDGQRYVDLPAPQSTVGRGPRGDELPPRPQRPRPPAGAGRRRLDPAQRASTSCSSSPASRPPPASAPASTAWACASGSAWPPPCSATPRCSSSTSPPTAWTPRASAGCAASCATSATRARRSSSRATCSRRSSRPSTRSSSSPTAAWCAPARWPTCTARRAPVVRTSDRERLAGALRVADVTSAPGADDTLVADTTDLRLVGDVALRAGLPIYGLEPKRADLEALFFELTEGTNRNETAGGAPAERGCRDRPGRGEPVIPAIRSEFRKFFTTRLWWGMAIAHLRRRRRLRRALRLPPHQRPGRHRRARRRRRPATPPRSPARVYTGGLSVGYLLLLTIGVMPDRLRVPPQDDHRHLPRHAPTRLRAMLAKVVALLGIGAIYGLISLVGSVSVGAVVLTPARPGRLPVRAPSCAPWR